MPLCWRPPPRQMCLTTFLPRTIPLRDTTLPSTRTTITYTQPRKPRPLWDHSALSRFRGRCRILQPWRNDHSTAIAPAPLHSRGSRWKATAASTRTRRLQGILHRMPARPCRWRSAATAAQQAAPAICPMLRPARCPGPNMDWRTAYTHPCPPGNQLRTSRICCRTTG